MKKILPFLLMAMLKSYAQPGPACGTSEAMQQLYKKNPALQARRQQHNESWQNQPQNRTATLTATYRIPVVVHILHQNGPENISDDQVRDALRVINEDYAKQNADFNQVIPEFQPIADSTKIQFVLATLDPDGNCTTGILHHEDTDTDWNDQSITLFSYTWDPTRYMNVYVVRSITMSNGFQAAGYAYYPGSWPDGFAYDAMVMLHNYFGTIGTGDPFLTRVWTHEAGHWLDLPHVFGDQPVGQDCSGEDYVSDTPPTMGFGSCPNLSQPATYQICTPGVSENFQNFMDYSYCTRMFTQGQAQRMQFCLQNSIAARNNLWSYSNLVSTGVINPTAPCEPIADFSASRKKVCVNVPVVFTDNSYGGDPATYSWSFAGASPATSAASVQAVTYATPGTYNATLTVTNAAGTSTKIKQAVVTVVAATAQNSGNWTEGFESAASVNNDWFMDCKNGVAYWERTNSASATGAASVRINRLSNTRKNRSSMTSPMIAIGQLNNPVLNFKVAVAESYPNHQNTLKVYVSSDCAQTWTQIYSKKTPQLITSVSTASNFVPAGASEWRNETVSLSAFANSGPVMFRYEYIRDTLPQTNHIYLDDINLSGSVDLSAPEGVINSLNVYPIPAKDELTISFSIPDAALVSISAVDLLGRESVISPMTEMAAGEHLRTLKAGTQLSPGVWFLKLKINDAVVTKKIVIGD